MDVVLEKTNKKNQTTLKNQKKDRTHYHLEQDSIKAKLADTYIFNSPKKKETIPLTSKKNIQKKYNFSMIIGGILLLCAVILISKNLFFNTDPNNNLSLSNKNALFSNGLASKDSIILTNLNFYGNLSENSKLTQEYIYLSKSRGTKKAGVEIKINTPINTEKGSLILLAKGEIGDENLSIVLIDGEESGDNTIKQIRISPHFGSLTSNWQKVLVPFEQIKEKNTLKKISSIAFEVSDSKKTDSKASCYLKDIVLLNE